MSPFLSESQGHGHEPYRAIEFDVVMINPRIDISPYSEAPIVGKIPSTTNLTGNYVTVSNITTREGARWYIKRAEEILVENGNLVYLTAANRTQLHQLINAGSIVGRARLI